MFFDLAYYRPFPIIFYLFAKIIIPKCYSATNRRKTLQNHILRFILQNADSAQLVDDTKFFISGQDIQYKILETTC